MYFIPSTPLMACSRGMVTADSTVCALAPIYPLDTTTCGGAKSGNCAMGREGIEIAPPRIISSAQTVANTGRWIKKSTNKLQPSAWHRHSCLCSLLPCRGELQRIPIPHNHNTISPCPLLQIPRLCSPGENLLANPALIPAVPAQHLFHHRRSISQKLQTRSDDVIARLNPVQNRVIIPNRIPNLQQFLPRHRALSLFHRQKRKKLSIDPRHRQNRNYRS